MKIKNSMGEECLFHAVFLYNKACNELGAQSKTPAGAIGFRVT